MNKDQIFVLEVKEHLDRTSWNSEREEILHGSIRELRAKGYSNSQIKELFKTISLKEQTNTLMVINNARYLELLDEILNS